MAEGAALPCGGGAQGACACDGGGGDDDGVGLPEETMGPLATVATAVAATAMGSVHGEA